MKAVLVFPPLAGASQPYSSLPALAGFVRGRGRHQVVQCDANLQFALRMLSPAALQSSADRVAERLGGLHAGRARRSEDDEYRRVLGASLKAPIVCDGIAGAVEDLRRTETYRDLPRLHRARRMVRDAFSIHSEACFPASLSMSHLSDEHSTAAAIERRARDGPDHLVRTFIADSLLPVIARERPGALGISITYPSQIVPAVTLALAAREQLPGVPLVFGGHIASRWSALPDVRDVFRWCDYLVFGEGETALENLLTALERGRGFDAVPNLAYRDGARTVRSPSRLEDIDELPAPDYRGLPLDRYLAPEPVFLLNTSRGCYWSACEFCSVSPSMRGHYRPRAIDRVAADIATLESRHAARCLMLGDDCVAPSTLRALSGLLRGRAISWECQVRFEPALTRDLLADLQRAGCRNLAFGLESYAPRVLETMNKGVRHGDIARILDDCREAGVAFNLQFFFGFPGETEAEARATVRFVVEQMHGAATCSVGTFELQRGSTAAARPGAFGLQVVGRRTLSIRLDYTPLPAHAARMKDLVERELAARLRFASVPLSLDAHTLLFLHEAGVAAMAAAYYRGPVEDPAAERRPSRCPPVSPASVVRRNECQAVVVVPENGEPPTLPGSSGARRADRIIVYDYETDRAVELSPLAFWALQQLDGGRSIADLTSGPGLPPGFPATVAAIVEDLAARGLVHHTYEVPADQSSAV